MSATGRNLEGHERHEDDDYATPQWCTHAIVPHLKVPGIGLGFDPCCGRGAILDVLRMHWMPHTMHGIELNAERAREAQIVHKVTCADTLDPMTFWPDADVIVTNPPYKLAMPIIERSIRWLAEDREKREAAFLLRLNFLGSQKRSKFHREHPADVYVMHKRPEFIAALSCKMNTKKMKFACDWATVLPIDADRPKTCPKCGDGVNVTTTDATEYAWYVWGPGRGNRWFMLDL